MAAYMLPEMYLAELPHKARVAYEPRLAHAKHHVDLVTHARSHSLLLTRTASSHTVLPTHTELRKVLVIGMLWSIRMDPVRMAHSAASPLRLPCMFGVDAEYCDFRMYFELKAIEPNIKTLSHIRTADIHANTASHHTRIKRGNASAVCRTMCMHVCVDHARNSTGSLTHTH